MMKSKIHENQKSKQLSLSRNLLMLLVAVLGTSAMVHAFPAKEGKTVPAKEIKATKHKKNTASKEETVKAKK
ncbi:hypothetical protein [Flavobacterium sp. FlaQc-28]|uniref:hypothetical protein n=1 Tax=Flavobacterium sp. FlaQc-28 TaxID=3374178 RepID=UPI0030228420